MRLGMLDVGSNTVHLLVVDAHPGAHPLPTAKRRTDLRLAELLDKNNRVTDHGAERLIKEIRTSRQAADELGVEDLSAFGTSALRDAANTDELLARIRDEAGVQLDLLDGTEEARLTFLAARRWFGWSAGRLLVIDIGGGSLEFATGIDEDPEHVASLPLGAGRLTRDRLKHDPPRGDEIDELRRHIRTEVARQMRPFAVAGAPDLAVGTSKTLRSLARIGGAAPSSAGPYVRRVLTRERAAEISRQVAGMPAKNRAKLPGVSAGRAEQLAGGALVADVVFELFDLNELVICPWALREGVILRRLDWLLVT